MLSPDRSWSDLSGRGSVRSRAGKSTRGVSPPSSAVGLRLTDQAPHTAHSSLLTANSSAGRARLSTLIVAFILITVAASAFVAARGRAANGKLPWPASLSRIFGSRTAPAKSAEATPLSPPAPMPFAPLLFWRTDGTSGTWTGTNWSNPASAAGGTGWTAGDDAEFSANSTATYVTGTSIGNLTVDDGKTVTVTQAGTMPVGSHVFTIGTGSTLTWTGQAVSDNSASSFDKEGAGTWNIGSQTNDYTGGFTLGSGTVIVTGAKSFGTAGMTINGGTLQSSGGITFVVTSLTIGGDFAFAGTGNDIWNQPVALGASTRTITNNTTGTATRTFSGIISGGSGAGLTFAGTGGSGGIVLNGSNTYTGDTTISAGKLSLGTTGSIANSTAIVLAGGSTFDVSTLTTPLTLASGQALNASGTTSSGTIATAVSKGLTTASDSPLQFTAFNGSTAPLTISGSGSVTLASGNLVTVTVSGSALGAGDYVLISKGASGTVNGTAPTSLTIAGSGLAAGTTASLQISGDQLVLHVFACPASFTVNDTGDGADATPGDGVCATAGAVCTLRAAIEETNALPACAPLTINFEIADMVLHTITPASPLPAITNSVMINGYSQLGTTMNSDATGWDGVLLIELNGTNAGPSANGLEVTGGNAIIEGLVINRFGGAGIKLSTNNNSVIGNFIGTDAAGTAALGNHVGVYVDNTSGNLIGCTTPDERNVISGNTEEGVEIYGASPDFNATLNLVQGNFIGTDKTGLVDLGNGASGVKIYDGFGNILGVDSRFLVILGNRKDDARANAGVASLEQGGNVISGNGSHGIEIATGDCTMTPTQPGNIVQGNFIGTDSGGTLDLSNDGAGVAIYDAPNNIIGDDGSTPPIEDNRFAGGAAPSFQTSSPLGNVIANNGGTGVLVEETLDGANRATGNSIRGNSIYNNFALGIDLTPNAGAEVGTGNGVTLNDPGDGDPLPGEPGPNELQNFPVLNSAVTTGGTTTINTSLNSLDGDYTVEFFANDAFDASLYGEGQSFIGSTSVTVSGNNVTFDFTPSNPVPAGKWITATATDLNGNTSEFSLAVQIATPTAANGNVSGQIVDSSGNPVEGAAVRMTGTQNRLTVTDANGNYHFDNVETNGFYTVVPTRANFVFSPSQRAFSQLGQHTDAAFNATPTSGGLNPLDTTEYFVRQQYLDFLGREPDESGFNFWVNNIEACGVKAQCRDAARINTSGAFFLSIEFQQTGCLVYRTYQAAYRDMAGAPVPLKLNEFKTDTAEIGKGVVVLQSGWETVLENNKRAYTAEFVQRERFTAAYPTTMTPAEFVDRLFANAGVAPSATDRTGAINEFGAVGTSSDVAARGRALRRVAENSQLAQKEFNQAFVLMQYFGYLRRDANSGPEIDFAGYNFWLDKLNTFNGNFQQAEMVKAFLLSGEYRGRFPR